MLARRGSLAWSPAPPPALAARLAAADPEALAAALAAEAARRLDETLAGIAAYRRHPYRRRMRAAPVIWREGTTRVHDYGARRQGRAAMTPVLMVPSLINRAAILDLSPRRSLARALLGRGVRPFLVDWGVPGEAERGFTLADYVAGRLEGALDAVVAACGRVPAVLGYCMGGLLALALAARRPLPGLALLATPWDFHAGNAADRAYLAASRPALETLLDATGSLPVDLLQAMFTWAEPTLVADKFRAFARLDPAAAEAADFVALEDWLNDGVPLVAGVARECLFDWYLDNLPGRRIWRLAGTRVDPASIACPALVAVPRRDRIVPPASAAALAAALGRATRLDAAGGHIGMVVGSGAGALSRPLARWLKATG